MAKKQAKQSRMMGIYVPDGRMADLDRWRDKINFSQLFWSAFDREVVRLSVTQFEGNSMSKLLERLKSEASADFEAGREKGLEYGKDWVEDTASLKDLREIASGGRQFNSDRGHAMEFLLDEAWLDTDGIEKLIEDYDAEKFSEGFDIGFITAVNTIWAQIKDKV